MKYDELIKKMTLEEKCSLLSGGTRFGSKAVERLGIPSMWLSDGPHGVRKQAGPADHLGLNPSLPATCYPTAATMANSWDPALGEQLGQMLGEEAKAQRVNVLLGPGLNTKRSPLCGRNFEYFSEDPYLAGKMAAAYVRGIQSQGVSACPKHFAVNSQERLRMHSDSQLDERTLREIYLTGFEITVREGSPKCIMSSYNRVNGTFASENEHLLNDILRKEWGFGGFSVTDWGGSNDRVAGVKAGTNLEMPTTGGDTDRALAKAVRTGELSEEVIDERVNEFLAVLFDTVIPQSAPTTFDEAAHHAFAKKAAGESIVLLKNEGGILPLKPGARVAVIGDFANKPRYQGGGSSSVNVTREDIPLDCLRASGLDVIGYAPGFLRHGGEDAELEHAACELAKQADTVLLYLGLDELAETEGMDRENMALRPCQVRLISELSKVNANIVAVFAGGSPVETAWLGKCKALLHGYYGGQAGAAAMADAITGKINPSGKLAETWPISLGDTPAANYYPGYERTAEYREGIFVGYRYYATANVPVRFEFGFGLSYTQFAYSDLRAESGAVTFTVANTGSVAGAEIAQVYVGKAGSEIFRPARELKGFVKVRLAPGESKRVTVPLDDKAYRYWNTLTNVWEIEPGTYQIMVGASSADIRLKAEVELSGTGAPVPYSKQSLAGYYSAKVQNISDEEYAALLGRPIAPKMWQRERPLELNDTFAQLEYAKGWVGRLVFKITKSQVDKSLAAGKPDLDAMFRYNMPIRAIAKMTAGGVDMAMANALLTIFNGHFFKGAGEFIGAYFAKTKAEKATAAALAAAGEIDAV